MKSNPFLTFVISFLLVVFVIMAIIGGLIITNRIVVKENREQKEKALLITGLVGSMLTGGVLVVHLLGSPRV